ncbi:MAG: nucleotidyltransferase domain-containing protein [Defluviitaleaceae bacterium]|nr:nucleotidyltransferase domain-containing protein [Defluviitaleaceae bacterium]
MLLHGEVSNKTLTLGQIKEFAVPFFKKYKNVTKVYVFGSYAKGKSNRPSIELVVEADGLGESKAKDIDISWFLDGYELSEMLEKNCRLNSFDTIEQFKKWAKNREGVVIYKR